MSQDKTLVDGTTGDYTDLKTNAVDPSDIETRPEDPRFGLPRFLIWTNKQDADGSEYWEAIGKDKTVYKVIINEVKAAIPGKVIIDTSAKTSEAEPK